MLCGHSCFSCNCTAINNDARRALLRLLLCLEVITPVTGQISKLQGYVTTEVPVMKQTLPCCCFLVPLTVNFLLQLTAVPILNKFKLLEMNLNW